jgi:hypothetical protein
VTGLPDRVDDVPAGAVAGVDLCRVGVGGCLPSGRGHQFERVPGQPFGERVEALTSDVDLQVVGSVSRGVVQAQREVVRLVDRVPPARHVHRRVATVERQAAAAQRAVGDGGLVLAGDALAEQAVPVVHRVGIGLPRLVTHRVLGLHGRIAGTTAPPLLAVVRTSDRIRHRAVRAGRGRHDRAGGCCQYADGHGGHRDAKGTRSHSYLRNRSVSAGRPWTTGCRRLRFHRSTRTSAESQSSRSQLL